MDLTYQDQDEALWSLGRISRSTLNAHDRVKDLFEIMQAVAGNQKFRHIWSVTTATDELLEGVACGQPFDIVATATSQDSQGKAICYVVVIDPVTQERREVARFLVADSGEIQYANGELMHSATDDKAPVLLLANISALVLAPRPE